MLVCYAQRRPSSLTGGGVMATLIECDGGCGKVSPERDGARLHIANKWIIVRWGISHEVSGNRSGPQSERIFCDDCWKPIIRAISTNRPPP